jgi:hypothetical protein
MGETLRCSVTKILTQKYRKRFGGGNTEDNLATYGWEFARRCLCMTEAKINLQILISPLMVGLEVCVPTAEEICGWVLIRVYTIWIRGQSKFGATEKMKKMSMLYPLM